MLQMVLTVIGQVLNTDRSDQVQDTPCAKCWGGGINRNQRVKNTTHVFHIYIPCSLRYRLKLTTHLKNKTRKYFEKHISLLTTSNQRMKTSTISIEYSTNKWISKQGREIASTSFNIFITIYKTPINTSSTLIEKLPFESFLFYPEETRLCQ